MASTDSSSFASATADVRLDCFDEFTNRYIGAKVRSLVRRPEFQESDRNDLIQEFSVDLVARSKNYNPTSGTWQAFVVVVCENLCSTLIRYRQAEKRTCQREAGSLNRPVTDTEGHVTEFWATLSHGHRALHIGRHGRTDEESSDVINDVGQVLDRLPPKLRELCECLKHGSLSQAAQSVGVSTKTVYRRKKSIRRRFERANLRDYV